MSHRQGWDRFRNYLCAVDGLGLIVDISRMSFDDAFLEDLDGAMRAALHAMEDLEKGAIANPDEKRRVGHYWLRAPQLAPEPAIQSQIRGALESVHSLADGIHEGTIKPPTSDGFYVILVLGIGGSALGMQFLAKALGSCDDPCLIRFIDNTDPDGVDRILGELQENLANTLTIVVSKSGDTKETRNALVEVESAYRREGLAFPQHAVAVTCPDSALHTKAIAERWLTVLPIWDWVGGRNSVLSAAGLLPAAVMGFDIDALLEGAAWCDVATREVAWRRNPAALMAAMWWHAITKHSIRHMVVLPYCDRLGLFARYLQQLVMESLGKREDRSGAEVHQGLTVFGNKGSTDQHAVVQQLMEGPNDFFVTFIQVRRLREGASVVVEDETTTGDYLHGCLLGTRDALTVAGRQSITITLERPDAQNIGALIALFERAVGLCGELMNVNAYHQPGVEAGKKAADRVLSLQRESLAFLRDHGDGRFTAVELAREIGAMDDLETIYHVLRHLANGTDRDVRAFSDDTAHPCDVRFGIATEKGSG